MEYHYFIFVELLSSLGFGHFAHDSVHVVYSWVAIIVLVVVALLLTRRVRLIPGKRQSAAEMIVQKLEDFMVEITGPEGRAFFPYIATAFLYILTCNLLGLVPGCFSPTADINTTLSLAICTFVLTHVIGVKYHGIKYLKHFTGPIMALAPLFFFIEIIGHFARVMSLSLRLFGNIFGKEKLIGILFALAGLYLAPLPLFFLGILIAFIQAVVFTLLSIIYFAGAMEEAH